MSAAELVDDVFSLKNPVPALRFHLEGRAGQTIANTQGLRQWLDKNGQAGVASQDKSTTGTGLLWLACA